MPLFKINLTKQNRGVTNSILHENFKTCEKLDLFNLFFKLPVPFFCVSTLCAEQPKPKYAKGAYFNLVLNLLYNFRVSDFLCVYNTTIISLGKCHQCLFTHIHRLLLLSSDVMILG